MDVLLDDPVFFAPFAPYFRPVLGRPSTPVECYLRLMFLKFRYRLGYESLCAEVSDSISWRRFCRIGLDGTVPHPTTLMKLTTRCGEAAVAGLNEALLIKAAGVKLLRTARVRADTTVIAANVVYPTDAGLLARAVGKLVRAGGGGRGHRDGDDRPATRCCPAGAGDGRHDARPGPARPGGRQPGDRPGDRDLAELAEKAAAQAAAVLRNGHRAVGRALRGRLRRALAELAVTIERTATVTVQARSRLAEQMPDGATRRTTEAGRRGGEGGLDNDDGIVVDYSVECGAVPDGPQLVPAITRVARRIGRVHPTVTADRGYGQAAVERDLHAAGVRTVAIPRQATTSPARKAVEHGRGFRKLVKWRTGCEGRISYLKHRYSWDRTRLDTRKGAAIWCGHGVFAHNLVKITTLAS